MKIKNSICFVDMDGVLSDFCGQVSIMSGVNVRGLRNKKDLTTEELNAQCVANQLADYSDEFWKTMPKLEGADDLLHHCFSKYKRVCILSKFIPPRENISRFLNVKKDKIEWIMKNFPKRFSIDDIIITRNPKSYYMQYDKKNFLIDDSIDETREWKASGGISYLYTNYQNFILQQNILEQRERF